MKIQCDVCERAPATVICCADEAALCSKCDVEVHAANKLASKHQRLLLHCLSAKLPKCDICQDKAAFIFCVEDRALFCEECDGAIHTGNTLAANHQRLLATGIQVALMANTPPCAATTTNNNNNSSSSSTFHPPTTTNNVSWSVDDLLHFSDFDSPDKKEAQLELGELEWLLGGDQGGLAAGEVPQVSPSSNRPVKSSNKKPRIEAPIHDDDEFFIVPDLG